MKFFRTTSATLPTLSAAFFSFIFFILSPPLFLTRAATPADDDFFSFSFDGFNSDVFNATSPDEAGARLSLAVEPRRIYEGESVRLSIRIDAIQNAQVVEIPDVGYLSDRFAVEYLGASNGSNVRVSYLNGVENRVEEKSVVHNFLLTPKIAGTLTIAPPKIVDGTRTLEAQPVELQVVAQTATDLVAIETTVAPQSLIYPLVPFEVTVDVFVKELPEKYRETDPITLISRNISAPRLSIPWLDSRELAEKTVPDVALDDWLGAIRSESGFVVNNFSFSNPFDFGFSLFDERRSTTFLPEKERVERTDANGETVGYWKYSFKRRLRAKTSGTLTFAPVSLKGEFLTFDADEKPYSQNVYVASKASKLEVAEIPEDSAPENYVGVFGKIRLNVDASAQSAAVGEALTLTATLRGYGSFDGAKAPELAKIPVFSDAFKIYPATERSLEDGVAFEYKIRPTAPGKTTIPAIEISYFDVETGKFVSESSAPIEIDVRENLLKADGDASEPTSPSAASQDVAQDAFPNDGGVLSASTARLVFGGIGGAALLLGLFFAGRSAIRANAKRVAFGNQKIVDAARFQLESGLLTIDSKPAESVAIIRLAFLRLLRRQFATPIASLTDAEVLDFLRSEFETKKTPTTGPLAARRDADDETLRRLREFFERAERVRFGGAAAFDGEFRSQTRDLFRRWVEFLTARTKKLANWAGPVDLNDETPSADVRN